MTDTRTPITPAVAIGFALLTAGLLAWLWLGDWRYAITGAALLLVAAVIGSMRRTP